MTPRPSFDRLEAALDGCTDTSVMPSALRTMRELLVHTIEEEHRRDALLDAGHDEASDVGLAYMMTSVGLGSELDFIVLARTAPYVRRLLKKFDVATIRAEQARRLAESARPDRVELSVKTIRASQAQRLAQTLKEVPHAQ